MHTLPPPARAACARAAAPATSPDRTPRPRASPSTLPPNPPSHGAVGAPALPAAHAQHAGRALSSAQAGRDPLERTRCGRGARALGRAARLQARALGRGIFAGVLWRAGAPAPRGRVAPAALLALAAAGRQRGRRGRAALRRGLALRAARRRAALARALTRCMPGARGGRALQAGETGLYEDQAYKRAHVACAAHQGGGAPVHGGCAVPGRGSGGAQRGRVG